MIVGEGVGEKGEIGVLEISPDSIGGQHRVWVYRTHFSWPFLFVAAESHRPTQWNRPFFAEVYPFSNVFLQN